MKTWRVYGKGRYDLQVTGDNLVDAIKRNIGDLLATSRANGVHMPSNCVDCVIIKYSPGILGAKGGAIVEFVARVPVNKVTYHTANNVVWINAAKDDLPSDQVEIRGLTF